MIVTIAASKDRSPQDERWSKFKEKHGKKYSDGAQDGRRRAHFEKNAARVDRHNERHARGEVTYTQALYDFSDQPIEDYIKATCPEIVDEDFPTTRQLPNSYTDAEYPPATADAVDWRSSMQPIVNQKVRLKYFISDIC